jgi:hypothetical protein
MVPTDLVFWLAPMPLDPDPDGVLCRRHADAMVVPRGWTLDDRRDPDLHLFRPPAPSAVMPRRRRTRSGTARCSGEQLELGVAIVDAVSSAAPGVDDVDDAPLEPSAVDAVAVEPAPVDAVAVASDNEAVDDGAVVWSPSFDESDDLDGLLSARSPLLSRAFRTADRDDR